MTIASNLGLKAFFADLASVATMFRERVLFHCAFGSKPQATVETAVEVMVVQQMLQISSIEHLPCLMDERN